MPEALERDVRASGRAAHSDWDSWSKERQDAYVYAVMRKRGWRPKREREASKR